MANVPQRRGSGFVNLQKYLGASSGKPLTQKVAGGISGTAEQAQTGLGKASDAFKQEVQSSTFGTPEQQQQRESILQKAQAGDAPGKLPGVTSDDVATYRGYAQAQYKGPQDLGSQGIQLLGQAQEAKRLGQAVGSEQGRKELLQRFVGAPQYTTGQRRLDELILGRGPQQQLKSAQQKTLGSEQSAIKQLAVNKALAQQAKQQTAGFAEQTRKMAENPLEAVQQDIESRLSNATQKQKQDYQNFINALGSGQITRDMIPKGGAIDLMTRTFGVDPKQYASMGMAPTRFSISSPEDQARYQALSSLAGRAGDYLPSGQQIGGYDPSRPYGFDTSRFMSDVGARERAYQQALEEASPMIGGGTFDPDTGRSTAPPTRVPLEQAIRDLEANVARYTDPTYGYAGGDSSVPARLANYKQQLEDIRNQYGYNKTLKVT